MKTIAFPFPVESLIDRVHDDDDDDGTERIQSEKMPAAAVAAAPLSRSGSR